MTYIYIEFSTIELSPIINHGCSIYFSQLTGLHFCRSFISQKYNDIYASIKYQLKATILLCLQNTRIQIYARLGWTQKIPI